MQSSKQDRHHYRQQTKVNINMQTQQLPPAENDVAVLLLFFNRTEVLQRTFDAIRKARPAHLFLYQDGPRNEADIPKTEAARRIVTDEEIDWQCDVQRNYQTNNKGVWAATYDSQQWAFGLHDKCIVLEDDSTPAVSFVRFCTEMLHRYEHDQRIPTTISSQRFSLSGDGHRGEGLSVSGMHIVPCSTTHLTCTS